MNELDEISRRLQARLQSLAQAKKSNTPDATKSKERSESDTFAGKKSLSRAVNLSDVQAVAPPTKSKITVSKLTSDRDQHSSEAKPKGSSRNAQNRTRGAFKAKADATETVVLTAQQSYSKALAWLAGRDYSAHALRTKLLRAGAPEAAIAEVMQRVQADGYQSDQRLAESKVRTLSNRGRGPNAVRFKLRQSGVAADASGEAIKTADVDWLQSAIDALQRKFKSAIADRNDYAKRARFLAGRGFTSEQIRKALAAQQANPEE